MIRLLLSLLLWSSLALGQPVSKTVNVPQGTIYRGGVPSGGGTTITWTCPTTRTNETAFDCDTEVLKFQLEITYGATVQVIDAAAEDRTRSIAGDPAGTLYRVRVCDVEEICSSWSTQRAQF